MPITPRFVLSQTDEVLTVTIRTPHVRVSASTLEVVIDDDAFHFYSPPYLLRLTLPGRLVDDAESGREAKATYDPSRDNGTVTVTIYKAQEDVGQWDGLDLVGRLMMNTSTESASASVAADANGANSSGTRTNNGRPTIEVLSSEDEPTESSSAIDEVSAATATGSATIAPENATSALLNLTAQRYGFLQLYHSVFTDLAREGLCQEMLELPEPDATLEVDRRSMRLDIEADKFDPGRYLDDAILGQEDATDPQCEDDGCGGDMIFDEAVHMIPHWSKSNSEKATSSIESITSDIGSLSIDKAARGPPSQLTEDEMQLLASVPATHIPPVKFVSMNQNQTRSTLLSLLDILFAYAYDYRTTGGDPTVESSWTVAILSPTLSWFDTYNAAEAADATEAAICIDTPADVLLWCIRRSLVYPYLRSYNLGAMIANDAISILQGGRRIVLRCLLQLRKIFENSTGHYLLNKLYIDPIIFWVQSIEESVLSEFAGEIEKLGKDMRCNSSKWKERIGLNLIGIEKMLYEIEDEHEGESESESLSEADDDSSGDGDSSSSSSSGSDEGDSDSSNNDREEEESSNNNAVPKVSSELLQMESTAISDEDKHIPSSSEKETGAATRKPLIQEL